MSEYRQPGKCGTSAGYQAHRRYNEEPCDACREAARIYVADYRARQMPGAERERMRARARSAALWRLKDLHRREFDILVADEMRVEAARLRSAS